MIRCLRRCLDDVDASSGLAGHWSFSLEEGDPRPGMWFCWCLWLRQGDPQVPKVAHRPASRRRNFKVDDASIFHDFNRTSALVWSPHLLLDVSLIYTTIPAKKMGTLVLARLSSGASRIGIERKPRNASNLTGEIKSSTSTSTQAGMSTPSRHASMAPTECPHSARSNTHTGSSAVASLSPRLRRSQVHLHTSPPRSPQMPSLHRSVAQQEWKNTNGIVIFDAGSADTLRLDRTDGGLPCDAFG